MALSPGKQLLVVDDDPIQREILVGILEEEFTFDLASSAKAGIKLIRGGDYAVVLSDFELGDGTGGEVLREAVSRDASGILMTGQTRSEAVQRLREEFKFLVLFKPLDPTELLTWVRYEISLAGLRKTRRGVESAATQRLPASLEIADPPQAPTPPAPRQSPPPPAPAASPESPKRPEGRVLGVHELEEF